MPYRDVDKIRKTGENKKYFSEQTDTSQIKNSIKNILLVKKGTLPGDPEFGSKLSTIAFGQMDGLSTSLQESFIKEQLYKYEPRVRISEIVFKEIHEFNRLIINIRFEYVNAETGMILEDSTSIPLEL